MLGPLEVRTDDDSGIVLDVGGSRLRALQALVDVADSDFGPAVIGRLLTALAGQQTLLVLDNCEHLIESAAALVPQSHPALER